MIDDFNGKHVIIPSVEEEERNRMATKPLLLRSEDEEVSYTQQPRRVHKQSLMVENLSADMDEEEKRKNSIALYLIIPGVIVPGLLCYVWMCYLKDIKSFSLKGTRVIIQVFSVFTTIIQIIFLFIFAGVIYLSSKK